MADLWLYRAKPHKVVDGDTVDLVIDQGFHNFRIQRFRLARIDAIELHSVGGLNAQQFTDQWLHSSVDEWDLFVHSESYDKYGRAIGEITRNSHCLSDDLVTAGHAVYKRYK